MQVFSSPHNIIKYNFENNTTQNVFKDFIKPKQVSVDCFMQKNDILHVALYYLENLTFDKNDTEKIKALGAKLIFNNGKEALVFAKKQNIKIVFADVEQPDIHAQWINNLNTIVINSKYKNSNNQAEIYAISAAILHELAHAKDSDELSSIQEEIDCLSMNALAFSTFRKKNPSVFNNINSPILQDGVALYAKLFLGNDKPALIKRIKEKYGYLTLESPNHKSGSLANAVKKQIN